MERLPLSRMTAGFGLAMMAILTTAAGSGCQSTRSEVPPHRSRSGDGKQAPMVGFSSEPDSINPNGFAAMPGASAAGGGPAGKLGMSGAGSNVMGAPTGNSFGPMGATPPPTAPEVEPAPSPTPSPSRSDQGQGSGVPSSSPFESMP